MKNTKFLIEVNDHQLSLLEFACELVARLRFGQLGLGGLQDILEEAWCKTHKEKIGSDAWYDMREKLEKKLNELKWDIWKYFPGQSGGVHSDDKADIYFDMYTVLRHARYLSFDEKGKELMRHTVMADKPMAYGDEPLIKVTEKDEDE